MACSLFRLVDVIAEGVDVFTGCSKIDKLDADHRVSYKGSKDIITVWELNKDALDEEEISYHEVDAIKNDLCGTYRMYRMYSRQVKEQTGTIAKCQGALA